MHSFPLLAPVAVLILWSIVVLVWSTLLRLIGFKNINLPLSKIPRGSRYSQVEVNMPNKSNWASHNYTHLMEQPTLFYAVVMLLSLVGEVGFVSIVLAWVYVLTRIVHSVWQSFYNIVLVRMILFGVSSLCLLGLAIIAVGATLF